MANTAKLANTLRPALIMMPPTAGPAMAPKRPMPMAQPTIDLSFTEAVQLLRLIVTDSGGKEAPTEFSPSAAAQKNFATVLPVLAQDTYTVNWTVLGDDGHRVENSFTFSVDATATETTGAVTEPHTGDGH